jgi:hypothetical protein
MIKIILTKYKLIVYLNNFVFFKQNYIINKQYTFFLSLHILYKYGLKIQK